MKYEMNFGRPIDPSRASSSSSNVFRIAILGDLSGRSNRGELGKGDEIAGRKPHRVDVDNLDEVLARFGIQLALPVADGGGTVHIQINSMDDFHPDELYEQLPVFEKLANLRNKLHDSAGFDAAAKAVVSLASQKPAEPLGRPGKKSAGSAIPNRRLDDFDSLISQPRTAAAETPIVDLLKQVVAQHVVAEPNPQQEALVATVDGAISATMRRVLHHPDFQSMESVWRSIELLVRRLETDESLQIVLYDITAEELAADLSAQDQLEDSGLFRLLVEQPALDAQQGPLSVILGCYTFEPTPPHADLLGRMAQIAAAANAPFIAAMNQQVLKKQAPEEVHPLVKESWTALRELPVAPYLMLTVPRFLLRWPYGKQTDPIDAFEFEEFTRQAGVSGMLWANGCFLAGLLLGETCRRQGLKGMQLGSIMSLDDMPFYYYVDEHGDQVPLPCTDRLLSERLAAFVASQNFAPVLGIKGRPEVRLGNFRSLAGGLLAGPWAAEGAPRTLPPSSASAKAPPAATAPPAPPQPVVAGTAEPAPAPPPAEAVDDELDSLLNELDTPAEPPAAAPAEPPAEDSGLDELDALLAEFDDPAPAAEDSSEMDDDLAALLADL